MSRFLDVLNRALTRHDREFFSYTEPSTGIVAKRVEIAKSNELILGSDYDNIAVTYPTNIREVFTFSLSAVTVRTVTVDYSNSSKNFIINVGVVDV